MKALEDKMMILKGDITIYKKEITEGETTIHGLGKISG